MRGEKKKEILYKRTSTRRRFFSFCSLGTSPMLQHGTLVVVILKTSSKNEVTEEEDRRCTVRVASYPPKQPPQKIQITHTAHQIRRLKTLRTQSSNSVEGWCVRKRHFLANDARCVRCGMKARSATKTVRATLRRLSSNPQEVSGFDSGTIRRMSLLALKVLSDNAHPKTFRR